MNQQKKVEIVPYNLQWPCQYASEAKQIQAALQDNLVAIYHVGSTAVPGLCSKNKIDMIAVVKDPITSIKPLAALDYVYKGEWNVPLKYGFTKRGPLNVNLHMYMPNHPEIALNLMFRDYLIQNPKAKEEYAALKLKLVQDKSAHIKLGPFFYKYTIEKGAFIRKVLNAAGFNEPRILKASDHEECELIKSLLPHVQDIINNKHFAYLVLYRGIDMLGCAEIDLVQKNGSNQQLIFCPDVDKEVQEPVFVNLIQNWLLLRAT